MIGKLHAFAFAALAALALAQATPAAAQPAYGGWMGYGPNGYGPGPGMMGRWAAPDQDGTSGYGPGFGPGYGQGYGMGPGMMYGGGPRYGYGPGMMGWWNQQPPADLNLTLEQVKSNFERWLTFHANPRVKLGPVTEKDGAVIVDIVTVDKGGLVQRFSVDRKTGATRIVEG